MPNPTPIRAPEARPTSAGPTCIVAAIVACGFAYGLSRLTGRLSESVDMPVGTPILVIAVLLSLIAPIAVGLHWGTTGRQWKLVTGALTVVAVITVAFRLTGSSVPYGASVGEFVLVPVGEELMFRGLVLGILLTLLRHRGLGSRASMWAVLLSALAFGVGHAGNVGYVDSQFVALQVFVATTFGLLAGWLRIKTDSLVGPVLLHVTMNVLAVT
jgi:membrane protease YdiL (CAAX protease family)